MEQKIVANLARNRNKTPRAPTDSWKAFAYFVSKCSEGFAKELQEQGNTDTEARNGVIACFLDFAAGEACWIARSERREPNHDLWREATDDAFARAVKRTAQNATASDE